eukprot:3017106-Prymnesium_polylepis.1
MCPPLLVCNTVLRLVRLVRACPCLSVPVRAAACPPLLEMTRKLGAACAAACACLSVPVRAGPCFRVASAVGV